MLSPMECLGRVSRERFRTLFVHRPHGLDTGDHLRVVKGLAVRGFSEENRWSEIGLFHEN